MLWLIAGFVLTGMLAGPVVGLLGVGGSLVIVPALFFLFRWDELHPVLSLFLAAGIAPGVVCVLSVMALSLHFSKGAIHWDAVGQLAPGLLMGAWIGSFGPFSDALAQNVDIILFFALLHMLLGIWLFWHAGSDFPTRRLPAVLPPFVALVVGIASTLWQISGGALCVAFLVFLEGMPTRQLPGTLAMLSLIVTGAALPEYILAGWDYPALPFTPGFALPLAVIAVSLGAVATLPLGVRLAHTLPSRDLNRAAGCLLLITGSNILII
jgi:uncharacterized membrane protein YfcA